MKRTCLLAEPYETLTTVRNNLRFGTEAITGFVDSVREHSLGHSEDKSCRECSALPASYLWEVLSGAATRRTDGSHKS